MPDFSAADSAFMARALRLAERGIYTAHPNPMVGCVLVQDGVIVGEGWHERAGEAHAEINALASASDKARGATAYLTLEPCSHHGKTPPCAPALIEAGIGEVVIAMQDPFTAVSGNGKAALEAAGIRVRCGLMRAAAEALNAGFLSRVRYGRPLVRLKVACSIDGAIAMKSGESQWITGPEARADVQRLRARSGAILTGIGTVLADDPALTVRDAQLDNDDRQPIRAVLDSRLRMPLSAGMLAMPGETLLYCSDDARQQPLLDVGAQVVRVNRAGEVLDVKEVLADLAAREVNEVLVEAGPAVSGYLLARRLVDELVIYQAPHIMGSETRPMFSTPEWARLADRAALDIVDLRRVGTDTRMTARLKDECLPES
jgi:diaminohydroxyphosphoribosylaminopyrimidine deaminase/5-amino-6-(5-phosphoribosylamino)uracil reductase